MIPRGCVWFLMWSTVHAWQIAQAFVPTSPTAHTTWSALRETASDGEETASSPTPLSSIQQTLQDDYPGAATLFKQNGSVWKSLARDSASNEFTLFAPNAKAMDDLGDAKLAQLLDPRNLETTEKIVAYHAILGEKVTPEALFEAGGILTYGGEVPVDRSTSGGLFGMFGATEDGGVTINGAKVVRSIPIGQGGILHEIDNLISPNILWRYMDQLRIPGSK